jgi:primosomal protein N'
MARYDVRKAAYYLEYHYEYIVVLVSESPRVWNAYRAGNVFEFLTDGDLIDLACNWGWRGF